MCGSLAFFPSLDPSSAFGIYQVLLHPSQVEQTVLQLVRADCIQKHTSDIFLISVSWQSDL